MVDVLIDFRLLEGIQRVTNAVGVANEFKPGLFLGNLAEAGMKLLAQVVALLILGLDKTLLG